MIGSSIVWKMAFSNLRKHWRQTLLTAAAGAIGAILIAVSAVNYDSVNQSGKNWIDTRLGPINWKLTPEGGTDLFTREQLDVIRKYTSNSIDRYEILPYVGGEAAITAGTDLLGSSTKSSRANETEPRAVTSMLLLGFSMKEAALFDPARAQLWEKGLGDDELILNDETASLLQVKQGDTVNVMSKNGDRLLRVREVTEQAGLTGYRESGNFRGTAIVSEKTAREMAGMDEEGYRTIFATSHNPSISVNGMFSLSDVSYQVEFLKYDYLTKVKKMNFTLLIGLISSVAVVSSLLFMRQVLIMIGESRRNLYGILRAIGMTQRNISSIFMIEAVLLSLLSAGAGTIIGLLGGYGMVDWVYSAYAEELTRMSGEHISVYPHLSIQSALTVFAIVLLFLLAVSLMAARKAGKVSITDALKGAPSTVTQSKKSRKITAVLAAAAGVSAVGLHIYYAFIETPELDGNQFPLIILSWLGSCFAVLYAALALLSKAGGLFEKLFGILKIPKLSIMLALKYPRQHSGRNYTAALLFALVMMTATFTVTITSLIVAISDVDRTNQAVFGYGGYASYRTDDERNKIIAAAANDSIIGENIKGSITIEPFMINFLEQSSAQSVIPVSFELSGQNDFKLLERSPEFSSDAEAWEAVNRDPKYIILPPYYMEKGGIFDAAFMPVKAGDTITLSIYEDKLRSLDEKWQAVGAHTFVVAGFTDDESKRILIDLYAATFVHPSVAEELRPYGFKWQNQPDLGFVLFDFDYKDIKAGQLLEQRFALQNILTFKVPYLDNRAEQLMNKQFGKGFTGFTVFSALIGLMGLAVIQYRAVQERLKQIAMMRCIGVPGKQVYWAFLIEGFVISITGLAIGWASGFSGSHLIIQSVIGDLKSYEEPLHISYPYEVILPVLFGLALLSLLLNTAPARAAVKLKAADALRMNQD
ncbi:ABC transporter permease [Paenibacillus sp. GXUN7292]|uniref:ABC transporter permease n=1 Tax=Paenibacillus sp. GXUN7292 TaxID=3422499 RepID=UPI003D7E6800